MRPGPASSRSGRAGLRWPTLARVWRAVYFSWHSEETDEYGYDPKFAEAVSPFFEFLYSLWWRVEATGVEQRARVGRRPSSWPTTRGCCPTTGP